MWKRALAAGGAMLALGVAALLVNAWRIGAPLPARPPLQGDVVDGERVARDLAGALRFATVSHDDPALDDAAPRRQLAAWLSSTFPRLHAALERRSIRGGLLYTWKGRDPSLRPVLFAAHMDVVPAESTGWSRPPFAGEMAEGFIWGRGALDDKGSLICILEAVETLVAAGFSPPRTILLAFGGDEETRGEDAAAIAEHLRSGGVRLEWALDEGLMVTDGFLPGMRAPVAFVGVGEKGYLSIELTANGEGGHSSMPPQDQAIAALAAALGRVKGSPLPAHFDGVVRQQMEALAPYMPFAERIALANLWLFSPAVAALMEKVPAANATLRTTVAATIVSAGEKENVLPRTARAVLNARIAPGDTVESVLAHVRRSIGNDRIGMRALERGAHDPPPLSPVDARGYRRIESAIQATFPQAVVVPALVLGATDGRQYRNLAQGVYRWAPFVVRPEDLARIHGADERVPAAQLVTAVRAYMQLMREP